MLIFVG